MCLKISASTWVVAKRYSNKYARLFDSVDTSLRPFSINKIFGFDFLKQVFTRCAECQVKGFVEFFKTREVQGDKFLVLSRFALVSPSLDHWGMLPIRSWWLQELHMGQGFTLQRNLGPNWRNWQVFFVFCSPQPNLTTWKMTTWKSFQPFFGLSFLKEIVDRLKSIRVEEKLTNRKPLRTSWLPSTIPEPIGRGRVRRSPTLRRSNNTEQVSWTPRIHGVESGWRLQFPGVWLS